MDRQRGRGGRAVRKEEKFVRNRCRNSEEGWTASEGEEEEQRGRMMRSVRMRIEEQ